MSEHKVTDTVVPDYLEETYSPGDATKRLMKTQTTDKKEQHRSVGREFQHIEDLVYIDGVPGVKKALLSLVHIAKNTKPLEVKWDGSPALIFGRDTNGTFHFADKYAKELLTNPKEVYQYFTRNDQTPARREFALKMAQLCPLYAKATPRDFRGFIEAGLMYSGTPPTNENGEYYFTPNTVTYFVDPNSALGGMIANSSSGAAATAYFDTIPGQGGRRQPVGDKYKAINDGGVVIIPPKFTETGIDLDADTLRMISEYAKSKAQSIESFLSSETGSENVAGVIYSYVNSQVDVTDGIKNLGSNFVEWVQNNPKLKSDQQSSLLSKIQTNQKGINAIFKLVKAIMHLKNGIILAKEEETLGSMGIRAQLKTGEAGGEGFVHDPDEGVGPVKLVNRGTFTRANRMRN
jgi:hypothetical protein